MQLAEKRMHQLIADWVPRPYTLEERALYRQETHRYIALIKKLEAIQAQAAPVVNHVLEHQLFIARVDYRVKFSRLFRINDLPTEIVCNIFRFIIWSCVDHDRSIKLRLNLTWTCRHWRKIALEDPTLWSVIWFKDVPYFTRSLAWLERSGRTPKDIRISDWGPSGPMDVDTLSKVLDRLIPRIAEIRALVIVLRSWDTVLYTLDQLRAARLVSSNLILERFELHRHGHAWIQPGPGYEPWKEAIPLLGGIPLPTLKSLSLSAIHVDWAATPLSNLSCLDLRQLPLNTAPTFEQFRAILRNSPRLSKLILDSAGPSYTGRDLSVIDYPPIPLPYLTSLAMADFKPAYGVYILSQFDAPNIRDLTILNMGPTDDYSAFYAHMTGRMTQLRVLTLFNGNYWPGNDYLPLSERLAVVKWLESTPEVSFLRFGGLGKCFLHAFVSDPRTIVGERLYPQNRIVCPKLLYIEWQRQDPETVLQWIQHRKQIGCPVAKMYVNLDKPDRVFDPEIHRAMQASMAPGGQMLLLRPGVKAKEAGAA